MANPEHLAILKQGVSIWNTWRKEDYLNPDLSGANLSELYLGQFDLSLADLSRTRLRGSDLNQANFRFANLTGTDLRSTNLYEARLKDSYLNGTNLSLAELHYADLTGSFLSEVNFTDAGIGGTVFGDIDLRGAKGLETIHHWKPSTIGIDTIIRSHGKIPEIFLRNAGVPQSIIEQIPALIGSLKPIDFYSCFISYSSKDQAFADQLYANFISKGVRCWYAPENLKWGAFTRTGIDEAIGLHDKLLLILSKHSVASGWVEREVKTALAREKKEKRMVLFPVRIDNAVFDCPYKWATEICHERNIGDFTRWKNHDDYQKAFKRLLKDLKTAAE